LCNCVENQGAHSLLWNDNGKPRKEEAVQRLFNVAVRSICFSNNIDISPETNAGRGAVDFKFSQGSKFRAHLEIKLARNKKLFSGLNKQLPTYLEAEKIKIGNYMVVIMEDKEIGLIEKLETAIKDLNLKSKSEIKLEVIDARGKPSASQV